jgi:hypothetical protein
MGIQLSSQTLLLLADALAILQSCPHIFHLQLCTYVICALSSHFLFLTKLCEAETHLMDFRYIHHSEDFTDTVTDKIPAQKT